MPRQIRLTLVNKMLENSNLSFRHKIKLHNIFPTSKPRQQTITHFIRDILSFSLYSSCFVHKTSNILGLFYYFKLFFLLDFC